MYQKTWPTLRDVTRLAGNAEITKMVAAFGGRAQIFVVSVKRTKFPR
jgi:hypothetical protein